MYIFKEYSLLLPTILNNLVTYRLAAPSQPIPITESTYKTSERQHRQSH